LELHLRFISLVIFSTSLAICVECGFFWRRSDDSYWKLILTAFLALLISSMAYIMDGHRWFQQIMHSISAGVLSYVLIQRFYPGRWYHKFTAISYIIFIPALIMLPTFEPHLGELTEQQRRIGIHLLPFLTMGGLAIGLPSHRRYYVRARLILSCFLYALAHAFGIFSYSMELSTIALAGVGFLSFNHLAFKAEWEKLVKINADLSAEREAISRLLGEIGEVASESLDLRGILDVVVRNASQAVDASAGVIFLMENNLLAAKASVGLFPPLTDEPISPRASRRFIERKLRSQRIRPGEGIIGEVALSKKPILIEDACSHPLLRQHSLIRTLAAVPIYLADQTLGVIAVINRKKGMRFSQGDVNLLSAIASQAAMAINNVMLHQETLNRMIMERDLEMARRIQRGLLPKALPQMRHLSVAAYSDTAREVGGDYYDFIPIDENSVGIAIADVSGKGIPAALVTVMIRTLLHRIAIAGREPSEVLYELNESLVLEEEMFVTMIYAVWDDERQLLTLANAGHPRPILFKSKTGECAEVDVGDIAIGIWGEISPGQIKLDLSSGDVVLMYTDGLEDIRNEEDEMYSLERLMEVLRQNAHRPVSDIRRAIRTDIEKFAGDSPLFDDYTFIVMKIRGG